MLQVKEKNQTNYVNTLFSGIARKYDLLNNLMSLGFHKKWKEKAVRLALKESTHPVEALDICSGTGDLALLLSRLSPLTKITCVDNCNEMLTLLEKRIHEQGIKNISLCCGDVTNLKYDNETFDLITVGFGLRNLPLKEKCLRDVYRILKSGGVFACIDLGHPQNLIWNKIYLWCFFKLVPILGQIFAKNKEAYSYFAHSLASWYKQEELKDLLLKTGFKKCYFKNILGGIVAIHIAVK